MFVFDIEIYAARVSKRASERARRNVYDGLLGLIKVEGKGKMAGGTRWN